MTETPSPWGRTITIDTKPVPDDDVISDQVLVIDRETLMSTPRGAAEVKGLEENIPEPDFEWPASLKAKKRWWAKNMYIRVRAPVVDTCYQCHHPHDFPAGTNRICPPCLECLLAGTITASSLIVAMIILRINWNKFKQAFVDILPWKGKST